MAKHPLLKIKVFKSNGQNYTHNEHKENEDGCTHSPFNIIHDFLSHALLDELH